MNDDVRVKGNELAEKILRMKGHLDHARKGIIPVHQHDGYTYTIPVSSDIRMIIKAIVISAVEKDLAELETAYAAL